MQINIITINYVYYNILILTFRHEHCTTLICIKLNLDALKTTV
jgi:hypothetical protein